MTMRQSGFSLAELMVGMTIGLIVLSGVGSAYVSASRSSRESQASSEQVENGRQAIEFLSYDLRHAGYFGQLSDRPVPGGALPDPCETSDLVALADAMAFPVQAYNAPATSPLTCLGATDFVPGTDIVVVRRASTETLAPADFPEDGAIYLQANAVEAELQVGDSSTAVGTTKKADGTAASILDRDGVTSAPIQRYIVHVYFIAPCIVPAGGGASCTGAADDDGNPIPTLKRLQLSTSAGAAQMNIVPWWVAWRIFKSILAWITCPLESIQLPVRSVMARPIVEDADPGSTVNAGVSAGCASANPGSVLEWTNVVHADAHLLARSYRGTNGYTDAKTYNLGLGLSALAPGGAFKRHAFSSTVRFTNVSARREIPM